MNLKNFSCSTWILNILFQDGDLIVRNSNINDLLFIDMLQKENSFAVGFIQKTIWDEYVFGWKRNFFVLICEYNKDPVWYVLITPWMWVGKYAKIQQICIRNDARRLKYGTALISVCKDFCNQAGRIGFTLRCRNDLDANFFWQKLGFTKYWEWEKGKVNHVWFKASNDISLWKIDLNDSIQWLFIL